MHQKRRIIGFVIINAIVLLFGMQKLYCQSNYLGVSSTVKSVNLNSVALLETEQVQTNAVSITIKSISNFSVYASISSYSSSSGAPLSSTMFGIKLNNVSPATTANYNKIPLTTANQRIISGPATTSSGIIYSYDMIVGPVGFVTPPGNYNVGILFTMTQP